MKDNSDPAFPGQYYHGHEQIESWTGMTLRDYFAAKAMQGFLSNSDLSERWGSISDSVAAEAYATADAMLAERAKP